MPDDPNVQVADPPKSEETQAQASGSAKPGERTVCDSYRDAKALAGNARRSGRPNAYVFFDTALKSWCVK
jgi:hypothetical protein